MSQLLNKLIDKLFRVKDNIKNFKEQYPNEEVLVAGGTKAVQGLKDEEISYNHKWITSYRTVLILTNKRLYTNQWKIELENIIEAKLIKIKSLFFKGFVLKVSTTDKKFFQFGLQDDPLWLDQKVLELKIEDGKVKMSRFSVLLRLTLLIIFLLFIYKAMF
ncbi:hypothetical protein [Haloplasma contractile]|uniref:YokE-like PH domain-containing protein n=1 Tax=Haloplasma contractile SSD-17B TaxID=1033810 RepID=U2FLZ2_9MOLU|nr:hypothetical protein [Haloplasma contractile]ERJ13755.1 hypothetical protein HLPCO_000421 [Haloplasma contractile SSD-17B]